MKNKIIGIVGIAIMVLSFFIPEGGGKVPEISEWMFYVSISLFFVLVFFTQKYLKTNHPEQYERCEKRVPEIF